jgi:RNA polymerase sigma-70 factor (ECF subfamily)
MVSLIHQHEPRIRTIIRGMVGSPEDAQDILQNVWLNMATKLPQLNDPERLGHWVSAIARNAAIDFLRSRQSRVEGRIPEGGGSLPSAESEEPESSLLRSERRHEVWQVLGSLGERDRLVLLLREFEGRSYAEIAEVIGTSRATAHVIVCRARGRFRELFHRQARSADWPAP